MHGVMVMEQKRCQTSYTGTRVGQAACALQVPVWQIDINQTRQNAVKSALFFQAAKSSGNSVSCSSSAMPRISSIPVSVARVSAASCLRDMTSASVINIEGL